MKKFSDVIICIICLLISFSLFILLILGSHEDFSERENKALQKMPNLSFNSLANGSFFSKLSDFSADQFPFRSLFCSISSLSDLALRKETNGVIVTKDGYLAVRPEYENTTILSENLDAISKFFEANNKAPSYLLVAPRAIDVIADKLPPSFYDEYGENEYRLLKKKISSEKLIDTSESLKNLSERGQQIWYKSDHHWTTIGAYEAYLMLCQRLGESEYSLEHFNTERVSDSFLGSSFSRSGLPEFSSFTDTVEIYRHTDDQDTEITAPTQKKTYMGFYDETALLKKDKYRVFLGGNLDLLQIRDTKKEKQKILLIKDSFANSLIPFLALHYDIDVIDLRYYKASLKNYIEENKFDKILLVFGIDTLSTDTSCTYIIK